MRIFSEEHFFMLVFSLVEVLTAESERRPPLQPEELSPIHSSTGGARSPTTTLVVDESSQN
jgi:hypothetical protein